jgi:nitric oxide reductase subunit B
MIGKVGVAQSFKQDNLVFRNEKLLKISFWSLNIGLAMMTFLSLLPQGLFQTYVSIDQGYFFARSSEFMHSPIMEALVWARVPGGIVFSVGVVAFVWFVFRAFIPSKHIKDSLTVAEK